MIIVYLKDAPEVEKCRFRHAIPGEFQLVIDKPDLHGWFAVPEQAISSPEFEIEFIEGKAQQGAEIPRTVGGLDLTYFKEGELERLQRDPLAEIDSLKARVVSLEAKRL